MKLVDVIKEEIVDFPSKQRTRQVRDDRLKQRGMRYDEITGQEVPDWDDGDIQNEFHVTDEYGVSYAIFDTSAAAYKAIPRLELKSGKRGLSVQAF